MLLVRTSASHRSADSHFIWSQNRNFPRVDVTKQLTSIYLTSIYALLLRQAPVHGHDKDCNYLSKFTVVVEIRPKPWPKTTRTYDLVQSDNNNYQKRTRQHKNDLMITTERVRLPEYSGHAHQLSLVLGTAYLACVARLGPTGRSSRLGTRASEACEWAMILTVKQHIRRKTGDVRWMIQQSADSSEWYHCFWRSHKMY